MDVGQKRLNQLLSWGVGLVTVFITPWFSYDPLNVPRVMLLVVVASIAFFLILPKLKVDILPDYRFLVAVVLLFMVQMILVMMIAPGDKGQQFFGAGGRHTGFLAYTALVIILISAAFSSSEQLLALAVKAVGIAGLLSILYGLFQSANLDPIGWTNRYSPVIGFFGNPNFQAAFVGISASAISVFVLAGGVSKVWKALSLLYVILALYVIYGTQSLQGFLVYAIGTGAAVVVFFFKTQRIKKFRFLVLGAGFISVIGIALDIFQKSPWRSILYAESVSSRGDFWRAGWRMAIDHPFFGVGLDSYRDWYFRNRDVVAASRFDGANYTDSGHNILVDFLANGGFPLVLIYLGLIVLTLSSAIRVLKRMEKFDPYFISIFVVWVGFQAQSLISINQIALGIWGWFTSGLIIGYEINSKDKNNSKPAGKSSKSKQSANLSLRIVAGLIVGLGLGLPAFLADTNFRSSIDSLNIERVNSSAYKWPQDVIRMNYVSRLFLQNKLPDRALKVARDAVITYPENFEAWSILYNLPNTPENEKLAALKKMKELNPYAPELQ
jgi:O-antigen ligase